MMTRIRDQTVKQSSGRASTRRRILDAAIAMFDTEGVRAATVDGISARAGVTKRTLYYHFRSKDDLMVAALEDFSSGRIFDPIVGDRALDAREFVSSAFAEVGMRARDIRWKGCAFTRAAAELAGLPGHPAVAAARSYKKEVEQHVFAKLSSEGCAEARSLARRVVLLLDGAIIHGIVHHEPDYAVEACNAALDFIDRALPKPAALAAVRVYAGGERRTSNLRAAQ
jgi:AcrR family transcriptional regulator